MDGLRTYDLYMVMVRIMSCEEVDLVAPAMLALIVTKTRDKYRMSLLSLILP